MSRKKRKANNKKHKSQHGEEYLTVIEGGAPIQRKRNKQVKITPRNFHQDDLLGYLQDDISNIVFAVGPAGTGKTLLSTLVGIQALKSGYIDRFVITRPAVSVDEQHGFLPGSLQEKMAPWTRPIFDVFEQYFTPEHIEYMLKDGKLEIAPLAYMRGRNFENCYILADEMQNATPEQMKMLLTRVGSGSKMVVNGDLAQHDRGFEENGLRDFLQRFGNHQTNSIRIVEFEHQDIERHPVVEEVLGLY
jgi:phosphate starvation-inducible PhoH-like protein